MRILQKPVIDVYRHCRLEVCATEKTGSFFCSAGILPAFESTLNDKAAADWKSALRGRAVAEAVVGEIRVKHAEDIIGKQT